LIKNADEIKVAQGKKKDSVSYVLQKETSLSTRDNKLISYLMDRTSRKVSTLSNNLTAF